MPITNEKSIDVLLEYVNDEIAMISNDKIIEKLKQYGSSGGFIRGVQLNLHIPLKEIINSKDVTWPPNSTLDVGISFTTGKIAFNFPATDLMIVMLTFVKDFSPAVFKNFMKKPAECQCC